MISIRGFFKTVTDERNTRDRDLRMELDILLMRETSEKDSRYREGPFATVPGCFQTGE